MGRRRYRRPQSADKAHDRKNCPDKTKSGTILASLGWICRALRNRQKRLGDKFRRRQISCLRLPQRPVRLRALSTSCGCTDGLFSSLRRAAGRAFGADGGVRCRRLRRGSADGGRSASHRCAHDLAKTERMALRRPLCFLRRPASAAPMAGSAGRFCDQGNAPAARAGDRPLPLHEQQQAHRHHRHAADEAVDGKVVFAVFPRRGQQFVKGDEHHDAGHGGEEDAEHRV